jgi:dTDP-4-amino-4,6-dideoxygalactose transaminase
MHLDEWNARRTTIAVRYTAEFMPDSTNAATQATAPLILPFVPNWAEPAWHLYVVQHPQRDAFVKHVGNADIGTLIHYPIPPHLQQAYASAGYVQGQFPIAEDIAKKCLSLPIGPHLDAVGVATVINAVKAAA